MHILCYVSGRDERIDFAVLSRTGAHKLSVYRHTTVCLALVVEPPSSEVRSLIPKFRYKKTATKAALFVSGRDERIRTSDILHPMQALYQAELRPEYETKIIHYCKMCKMSLRHLVLLRMFRVYKTLNNFASVKGLVTFVSFNSIYPQNLKCKKNFHYLKNLSLRQFRQFLRNILFTMF